MGNSTGEDRIQTHNGEDESALQPLIQVSDSPRRAPARPPTAAGQKVGWISLGCPKNLVDSEGMLGQLQAAGFGFTPDLDEADAIVVNTCGFVEDAREESLAALRDSLGVNRRGQRRRVVAVGCLAQRYGASLLEEVEGLDAVVGMGRQEDLTSVLTRSLGGDDAALTPEMRVFDPAHYFPAPEQRLRLTPPWTAYVKISDGCDNPCTFCSIPLMRGKMRSRRIDDIEREVRLLADQGVREVVLIAQDSTHFGGDTADGDIAALLGRLARIDGPEWIRLMYAYPTRLNDRLIDVIAGEPRICNYVDMPLQHASDRILAAMKRPGTASSYLRLLERLRNRCPDLTIRTTMILGFPGETETDFRDLLQFVETARFDRLGAFCYSPEPGTLAQTFSGAAAPGVVEKRYDRLMRLQQRISLERNREWVGRSMRVLVESITSDGGRVGRSERDAPDVDGTVIIRGSVAAPGTFVDVRITGAEPYDLLAEAA